MLFETKAGYYINPNNINFIGKGLGNTYNILFAGSNSTFYFELEPEEFEYIIRNNDTESVSKNIPVIPDGFWSIEK